MQQAPRDSVRDLSSVCFVLVGASCTWSVLSGPVSLGSTAPPSKNRTTPLQRSKPKHPTRVSLHENRCIHCFRASRPRCRLQSRQPSKHRFCSYQPYRKLYTNTRDSRPVQSSRIIRSSRSPPPAHSRPEQGLKTDPSTFTKPKRRKAPLRP